MTVENKLQQEASNYAIIFEKFLKEQFMDDYKYLSTSCPLDSRKNLAASCYGCQSFMGVPYHLFMCPCGYYVGMLYWKHEKLIELVYEKLLFFYSAVQLGGLFIPYEVDSPVDFAIFRNEVRHIWKERRYT